MFLYIPYLYYMYTLYNIYYKRYMYYINNIYKNRVNIIWAPDTKTVQFFVYFVTDLVVYYRCLIQFDSPEDNH